CIKDGWGLKTFFLKKSAIYRDNINTGNLIDWNGNVIKKDKDILNKLMTKKFIKLIRKLLTSIEKKEYRFYKKYNHSRYETKEIVYSSEVKAHRRHFWEDSGRFKIPLMSKEELKSKGYGVDELVFRDGELRKDVPFRIIGSFTINSDKEKPKENRRIILFQRRIWKNEEKLFKILREIFQDEYIKKHDRKTLKGLELDFFIKKLNLAFEYDGEQHFDRELCENVFKSDFDALQHRDKKKDTLCKIKNIDLIRVKFNESLTKSNIKRKIKKEGEI
ncbi:MAG TPA: hypothetical protein VMZ91_11465, partial [Candidatus Paceibacterota bacterium]|nr:hypothetical protein [Candidatus Paceibacterota bacterium]